MTVTFDAIKAVDNGARFYTADLHVHSHGASADVSDQGMTVEAIIDAAVGHQISLLSITDHNSDKHVAHALEYAMKYAGRLLVLPGVEVTTANGHLLVYFAPEKAASVRDLLSRIKIVGQFGARDSHTTMSMERSCSADQSIMARREKPYKKYWREESWLSEGERRFTDIRAKISIACLRGP